jgi:Tfp pilus assembly protein PilF
LDILRELLEKQPGDTFVRYGLAMELVSLGRPDEALAEFEHIVAAAPDYLAAYYPMGKLLETLNRKEEAGSMFRKGMEVGRQKGDLHTVTELQEALDGLEAWENGA